ncbi:MAG: 50S ribosomal protein L35 [Candidatus Margulisbacteria bacterium]|nr:50S ribosomal protein L35 [Candidatus Margulisiibacteriota bacterium]
MPKAKTRKAAAKRFKITKTGKVLRRHANMRHLLSAKSNKAKRSLRKVGLVSPSDMARVREMLPGGAR